jgi:glycosyltransferase involved in cell wall biosynthesis
MNIGINCLRLSPTYRGGVNSFAFGLLDGFACSSRGHKFVIFASPENRAIFSRYADLPNFQILQLSIDAPAREDGLAKRLAKYAFPRLPAKIRYKLPLLALNKWWNEAQAVQIEQEVDALFVPYTPSSIFVYPKTPTLYSIHDLQHVHFPNFFTAAQRLERDAVFGAAVKHAARIQATSEQMHREFLAHFSELKPAQIVIIPEGVDVGRFRAERPSTLEIRARYNLPEKFILYPAQLWPHKDHATILRALVRLRDRGMAIPLVLTGAAYNSASSISNFIEESGLSQLVFPLGVVPYDDLSALYRAARFLVTASLYEAGSIPMLEAAAAGTPIIGSAIPSHCEHSEILKMQLFAPGDDAALADLLQRTWNDDKLIETQVRHNLDAVRNYTWNSAAERYLDSLEAMAGAAGNAERN